jgi:hypothetical protein
MKSEELREHITATYLNLRWGLVALALALLLILPIGGYILSALPLQGSLSAYYHSGGGVMRDEFVGILIAVGVCLSLYKGFTSLENHALNLAGAFLIGVAIFPMEWECGAACKRFSLHGTCAVLFFLCIAYVCVFRASDTLHLIKEQSQVTRYKRIYKLLGIGMIVSPGIAVLLSFVLQPHAEGRATIFFVEAAGVLVFAIYWFIKSRELAATNSERLAIEGKLRTTPYRAADLFKQIQLEQDNLTDKQ